MAKAYYVNQISPHRGETNEGFLICREVPVARTGHQFYLDSEIDFADKVKAKRVDGGYNVFRPPEEVFSKDTIASFEGKPVTNDHPMEAVTSENHKQYVMGTVQDVRKGTGEFKDFIFADLIIYDQGLINEIESGKTGVSAGYSCTYDIVDDELVQRNIICNHIAVVWEGRAGAKAKIRDENPKNNEVKTMSEEIKKECEEKESKDEGETSINASGLESVLKDIVSRLESIESRLQEPSELDKLDKEIGEVEKSKESESDEEEKTVSPEEVKAKDEDLEEEQEEIGDCSPLRKVVRTIKPLLAKVKDKALQNEMNKVIADSIRENLMSKESKKIKSSKKTVYNNFVSKQVKDSGKSFADYCAEIFKKEV